MVDFDICQKAGGGKRRSGMAAFIFDAITAITSFPICLASLVMVLLLSELLEKLNLLIAFA